VDGDGVLTRVVHSDHETSAFRYTQLADRRRDVSAATSGPQVDHLPPATDGRAAAAFPRRDIELVLTRATQC